MWSPWTNFCSLRLVWTPTKKSFNIFSYFFNYLCAPNLVRLPRTQHFSTVSVASSSWTWTMKTSWAAFKETQPVISSEPRLPTSGDIAIRVTRLCDFSPNGVIVYFGQLLENHRSWANLVPRLSLYIHFDKYLFGLHLGWFFSHSHLVTLHKYKMGLPNPCFCNGWLALHRSILKKSFCH
jgi:hypothetical protein